MLKIGGAIVIYGDDDDDDNDDNQIYINTTVRSINISVRRLSYLSMDHQHPTVSDGRSTVRTMYYD